MVTAAEEPITLNPRAKNIGILEPVSAASVDVEELLPRMVSTPSLHKGASAKADHEDLDPYFTNFMNYPKAS